MDFYSFLVFVHVLGAVGLFAAAGIEAVALGGLRRARTPADARVWLGLFGRSGRLGPLGMMTAVVSGIWMAVMVWGHQGWLAAAMVAVVVMGALGGGVTGRRARRLAQALAGETGPGLSEAFGSLLGARALVVSLRLRIALAIGIVALMTVRPGPAGSTLVLAAATIAGLVSAAAPGARRPRQASAAEGAQAG